MHKSYYFLTLVLLFFVTGCVQSINTGYNGTISDKSIFAANPSDTNTIVSDENNTVSGNQKLQSDVKGKKTVKCAENGATLVSTGSLGNTQTSTSEKKQKNITTQSKIDHALELCQTAQTLWEKGELENALEELDKAYSTILELDTEDNPEFNQQKEDMRYMISKRILEIYASRNIVVNGKYNAIPITMNKYVKQQIAQLTGPDRQFLIQSIRRAGRYRPFIAAEMKKAGLPEELSWLPLIESGFKIRALSKSRALGLWQFIPSTGYKFGLNRNYYIDERLDPVKSTKAAIAYFKELHKIFGDWSTVLAAYNCGEGRVLRII